MVYTIELEKLTEEQLEAFKAIDKKAAEAEFKRREESIYSPEEMKAGKVYADLYKAYFYLKPMYDNMRNTDVKKVITQSEVLPIMEKIFRWADHNKVAFEKFSGEPVTTAKPETKEEAVKVEVSIPLTVGEPIVEPVTVEPVAVEPVAEESCWEPGGGAEVEQPEIIPEPKVIPLESKPKVIPMVAKQSVVNEELSPVESMTQQKLNEILASIPAVEKI